MLALFKIDAPTWICRFFNELDRNGAPKELERMWEAALRKKGKIPLGMVKEGDFVGHVAMSRHGRHKASVKVNRSQHYN